MVWSSEIETRRQEKKPKRGVKREDWEVRQDFANNDKRTEENVGRPSHQQ